MKADGELPAGTRLCSSKYVNDLVEQDHRAVKLRIGPMFGLKRFRATAITMARIELLLRMRTQGAVQPRSATSSGSTCAYCLGWRPSSPMNRQPWHAHRHAYASSCSLHESRSEELYFRTRAAGVL